MIVTPFIVSLLFGVLAGALAQAGSDQVVDVPDIYPSSSVQFSVRVAKNDFNPSIQGYRLSYGIASNCNANINLVPVETFSRHNASGTAFYIRNFTVGVVGFPGSETGNAPLTIVGFDTTIPTLPKIGMVKASCENTNVPTAGFFTVDALRGAEAPLHIPGGTWMACNADTLRLIYKDVNFVEGHDVLLTYKNAADMLPKACAEVELWPICDDVAEREGPDGSNEWDELLCSKSRPSLSNTSTPISSSNSSLGSTYSPASGPSPTHLQRPDSENSGVYGMVGMSAIPAIALVATVFMLL